MRPGFAVADAGHDRRWSAQSAPPFRLVDVTRAAGISFTHNNGAFGKKFLPETLGAGAAFLDYNNDGRQDILLVNGSAWPGQPPARSYLAAVPKRRRAAASPT